MQIYLPHHRTDVQRTQEDVRRLVVQKHATVQIIAAGKNVHYLDLLKIVCVEPTERGNGILGGGRLRIKVSSKSHAITLLLRIMNVRKYTVCFH